MKTTQKISVVALILGLTSPAFNFSAAALTGALALFGVIAPAHAEEKKPNILVTTIDEKHIPLQTHVLCCGELSGSPCRFWKSSARVGDNL